MEAISDILEKTIKRHGLSEPVFAMILIKQAQKFIYENMGKKAMSHISVTSYTHNIIHLKISSAVWAQEFQFYKQQLLDFLREKFPEKNILNIKMNITGREDLYDSPSFKRS